MVFALAAMVVAKPLVLAHIMPWFQEPPFAEKRGWHWTMGTQTTRLASHLTPRIGPYDSRDPLVATYQMLTLKLAGLDGIIIDWYGCEDVLDYLANHQGTLALVAAAEKFGLKFSVCYEDQTVPQIASRKAEGRSNAEIARTSLMWLDKNWLDHKAAAKYRGRPLVFVFGPQALKGGEWQGLMAGLQNRPWLLSLHHKAEGADGSFDWPLPNAEDPFQESKAFVQRARQEPLFASVAYPRFKDYYAEAGAGEGYKDIPDSNGKTYQRTLAEALASGSPIVQVATWNDYGEGTCIEPTVEYGFRDLEATQKALKSRFKPADLRMPERWLMLARAGKKAESDALMKRILALGF